MVLRIDNMISVSATNAGINQMRDLLLSICEIWDTGELQEHQGLHIQQYWASYSMTVDQSKYAFKILKTFYLENVLPIK